jgi:hypothetical protein
MIKKKDDRKEVTARLTPEEFARFRAALFAKELETGHKVEHQEAFVEAMMRWIEETERTYAKPGFVSALQNIADGEAQKRRRKPG